MSQAILQNITIYPIKSTAGISLSSSWVEELGLAFDRRFVIATTSGEFITARTQPRLCLIQVDLTQTGMILTAPNMPALVINYHELTSHYVSVNVWKDNINAQQCSEDINQWFCQYIQLPCQLLFFGEKSNRLVKNKSTQVSFADAYPLLLLSQASLEHLNSLYAEGERRMTMAQFRPNIVVNNCDAFAEDTWQHIRIGEVEFEATTPCTRCIFTTINPETGKKHLQQEPLKTLKNYRQLENGDVLFGQNLVALNHGKIKQGDQVEVLKRQTPPTFKTKEIKVPAKPNNNKQSESIVKKDKPSITFSTFNKTVKGNSKQTLLEQGEDANLVLPYSCRSGMCGCCKVQLISGEVEQHCRDGLSDEEQQQGFVLSCNATPLTDVVVSHPDIERRRAMRSGKD